MTSASVLTDNVAFLLFQNLKRGMQDGRIPDLSTAQVEVDSAIAELSAKRPPPGDPAHMNDLAEKLLREIGSLSDKVSKCETRLADFQIWGRELKEDTSQIVARTQACGLLVEHQQKEAATVPAAVETAQSSVSTTLPPCVPSALPPTDPASYPSPAPALCRAAAIISFPGGPRTVTIHPPGSAGYQSVVRDDRGDVIIDLRRTKPLRREGAFRGPIESINWAEITRVRGRAPEEPGTGTRATPPSSPHRPDRARVSGTLPESSAARLGDVVVVKQQKLLMSVRTGASGRVPPDGDDAKLLALPAISASQELDASSLPGAKRKSENDYTAPSTPPPSSPSVGRGTKRARKSDSEEEDDDGDGEGAQAPVTSLPATKWRRDSCVSPPKGPPGRKRMRVRSSVPPREGSSPPADGSPSPTRLARSGSELTTRTA